MDKSFLDILALPLKAAALAALLEDHVLDKMVSREIEVL